MYTVHEPVGYAGMLKHFRAGSVHTQFWCLGTGTHADAQGQNATSFMEGQPDPDALCGQP